MGQQQLLLIVLGVIVVGIAIAVGVNMFQSSAQDTNRQALIADLVNMGAKAQRYYRTPTEMGGGAQDFNGFSLSTLDVFNANGAYQLTAAVPSGHATVDSSTAGITAAAQEIYIVGSGREDGENAAGKVKAFVTITPTNVSANILN